MKPKSVTKKSETIGARTQRQKFIEAAREAEEAVALGPKSPIAWLAKAIAHEQKGEYEQAMVAYDRVLDLERSEDFLVRCAFLLATCPVEKYRSGKGALHIAKSTFSTINPSEHKRTAQIVTAIAIAECGEYKKASETIRGAMKIGSPDADLVKRCKRLEALFEDGKPYRHDAARPQDHIFSIPPGVLIYTPRALVTKAPPEK